jgi:putative transposase
LSHSGISDSVYRYQLKANNDHEVIVELQKAVERYPAYGFSKLLKIFRRWGHGWNHKRIYRIYCETKLNRRRKEKNAYQLVCLSRLMCLWLPPSVGRLTL